MQYKQTHIAILAAILLAGTMITSASAMYPYGSNPVLMKNAQAQNENGTLQGEEFPVGNNSEIPIPETGELPKPGFEDQVQGFVDHANGDIDQAITVLSDNGVEAVGDVNLTIIEEPVIEQPVANETGNVTEQPAGNETITEEPIVTPTPEETCGCVPETPVAEEEITPAEEQIVNDTEDAGTEIVDVIENSTEATPEEVDAVENATSEVVETVEETVTNGTESEAVEEVAEEAVEAVDNATENAETETEESANDALINLLEGLVDAQQYNDNLSEDEKTDLVNNLEIVKDQLG